MKFEYEEKEKVLTLKFDGEIDHHTCDVIRNEADYEIKKYLPKVVVFDFEQVRFMDSSGIGMLIGRYKHILRFGGQARMINVRESIKRVFEMSGIFKIIPLVEEEMSRG